MASQLISREALSRLDRHQVTLHVLMSAVTERARDLGDEQLVALVAKLAAVNDEHRHLLDAVMEAIDESR